MSKSAYCAVWYGVLLLLLGHSDTVESQSSQLCNGATDDVTNTCGQLSRDLENSLLQDQGNLFRLRRTFFHSPTASPVLLKVVYLLSYTYNISLRAAKEEIPYCLILTSDGEYLPSNLNNSALPPNQTESSFTFGWTSTGIYTVIHPAVLNFVQVQTAFSVLRLFHWMQQQSFYSPEADAFFWTGIFQLPTLYLNLNIQELSCIPSQALIKSVLEDLNTLVSVSCSYYSY